MEAGIAGPHLHRLPPAELTFFCMDTLHITSARHGLPEADLAEHPQRGDLFRLRPGVSGQVEALFAG